MKSIAGLFVAGIAGIVGVKLLLLPLLGLVTGVLGLILKIALIFAVGYFVIRFLKSLRRRRTA